MSDRITYEPFDGKSLLVFGDRDKFQKNMNLLGGRWNSRKSGWIIPLTNKNKLDNFISTLTDSDFVKSPHPKKYHREDSASEEEYSPPHKTRRELDGASDEEADRTHAKHKYGKHDPMIYNQTISPAKDQLDNPYDYYKSFNRKPADFRKENELYDSDDLESSTSEDTTSSSDDFPSPGTPRRCSRYKKTVDDGYGKLCHKVKDLQKRMAEMELQQSMKRRR